MHNHVKAVCDYCGVEFEARRFTKLYCSARCKQAYWRRLHAVTPIERISNRRMAVKARRQIVETRKCALCEKEFQVNSYQRAKRFCSARCRQRLYHVGREWLAKMARVAAMSELRESGKDRSQGSKKRRS